MSSTACHRILLVLTFLGALAAVCSFSTHHRVAKKLKRGGILRQKETNPINFIRLVAMRLIYGIAKRLGFGENISEALNGVFVPPGVDDYDDYGGFDLSDRDDYDDDDDDDY